MIAAAPVAASHPSPYHQRADSVLTEPHVRIQFLTPTLVRLEFSLHDRFVDLPTAVVQKRKWNHPDISVEKQGRWIVAKSSALTIRYAPDSAAFSRDNLQIVWNDGSRQGSWSPGDADPGNLGGIQYSLDGLRRNKIPKDSPGILSRSGFFVLDDSRSPVWDKQSDWIAPRGDKDGQDLYFFFYGTDYRHGLKEYASLCGDVPLIPRYTLGTWITDLNYEYLPGSDYVEHYHYTDENVKSLVNRFKSAGLPLDVLVLDFAWHNYGWKGGYDWSPIFPHPQEFLDWTRTEGLKVTLNDHPGYGHESVLSDHDSRADVVRKDLDIKPPATPTFTIDIAADWKFRPDPDTIGVQSGWFNPAFDDAEWKILRAGTTWEDQGYPEYDGFGWYRQWISIPPNTTKQPLYCIFGGVDDEYDLYVNGKRIAHHGTPGSSIWNSLTATDISKEVVEGRKNLIALRVNDWGGGGGITVLPVMLSDQLPGEGIRFNLADKHEATIFMDVLHKPLIDQGVAFWWVDGGSGSCQMEGLNSQMWTNRVFYDFTQRQTDRRGFIFSRYGGWGSHRYPGFFTGDTYSQWEVLAYEVPFTARGANVLTPYITHDLGGFIGPHESFDLWARWIEFGVFSPIVRLHSAHENPREGNVRMPWTYGDRGIELAKKYFRLRYRLLPYIYTYCRAATDEAVSLVRPLYFDYPSLDRAYSYPSEYLFGDQLLVSPVVDSTGTKETYLPPGEWIEYFTGQRYRGDRVLHEQVPIDRIPVFVRSGSIIPSQPDRDYSDQRPLDTLIIDVYGPQPATFSLYEDDGVSEEYRSGRFARSLLAFTHSGEGHFQLTVGAASGEFKGQPSARAYLLQFHGLQKPRTVALNGRQLKATGTDSWRWDEHLSVLSVPTGPRSIREEIRIDIHAKEK